MKKYICVLLCVTLMLLASACMPLSNQPDAPDAEGGTQENTQSANATAHISSDGQVLISGWGPHMFIGIYDSDGEKANQLLSSFCEAIEDQNKDAIIQIFSPNVLSSIDMDAQLDALFDYYGGSLCDYQRVASSSPGGKTHYYMATYEVSTTEENYRIAIKICYEDTADNGNVGIHSIYIIKDENADPEFAYWGGHVWENGIIIEDAVNN